MTTSRSMPQVTTTRLILIKVGNTAEMYNTGLFYGPVFLCLYGAVLGMCNLCHEKKGKKNKKEKKVHLYSSV